MRSHCGWHALWLSRGGAVRGLFLDLYAHFFRNRITVLCVAVVVDRLGGTSDKKSGLKGGLEASVLC